MAHSDIDEGAGPGDQQQALQGLDRRRNRLGDVITEVNGRRVQSIAEFAAALDEVGIGNEVALTVVRDKRGRTVKLKVADIS